MCIHSLLNINPNACTVRFESQSGPLLNSRRFSQIAPASRHVWRHSVSRTYAFIRRWHWHTGCMLQNAKVNCSNSLIWGKHLRRIPNSSGSYNPSMWFDGKRPKDTITHMNSIQLVMWFHIVPTRANIAAAWPTLGKQWGSRVWNSIPWLLNHEQHRQKANLLGKMFDNILKQKAKILPYLLMRQASNMAALWCSSLIYRMVMFAKLSMEES